MTKMWLECKTSTKTATTTATTASTTKHRLIKFSMTELTNSVANCE